MWQESVTVYLDTLGQTVTKVGFLTNQPLIFHLQVSAGHLQVIVCGYSLSSRLLWKTVLWSVSSLCQQLHVQPPERSLWMFTGLDRYRLLQTWVPQDFTQRWERGQYGAFDSFRVSTGLEVEVVICSSQGLVFIHRPTLIIGSSRCEALIWASCFSLELQVTIFKLPAAAS